MRQCFSVCDAHEEKEEGETMTKKKRSWVMWAVMCNDTPIVLYKRKIYAKLQTDFMVDEIRKVKVTEL